MVKPIVTSPFWSGRVLLDFFRPACLLSRWVERNPVTQPAGKQSVGKGVAGNGAGLTEEALYHHCSLVFYKVCFGSVGNL